MLDDRTVRLSGRWCLAAIAAAVTMGVAAPAAAQGTTIGGGTQVVPTRGDAAIPLGLWRFMPAVQVGWYQTDNLFRTAEDTVSDSLLQAAARLQFDLDLSDQSGISFAYNPIYRSFDDFELEENWSHLVRLKGDVAFPMGLRLTGNYDYTRSSLDVRDVDPSGELAFSAAPYTRQQGSLRADYLLSYVDAISADVDWNDVDYSGDDFFGSTVTRYGIGWVRNLNPVLVLDLRVSRRETEGEPVQGRGATTSTGEDITLQLRGQLTPVLETDLRIGWRRSEFQSATGGETGDPFESVILSGGVNWQLTESVRVTAGVSRSDYLSAVADRGFSVTTTFRAGVSLDRGRLGGSLSGSFGVQDFSGDDFIAGEDRDSDEHVRASASVRYQVAPFIFAQSGYSYSERRAGEDRSFTASVWNVGVVVGF